MKNLLLIIAFTAAGLSLQAQTTTATATLLPDQNPNYQKSRDKYMAKSDELTANEGKTVQQTYKAIDDMQAKQERKDLAAQRRHERRMARIQSRNRGYNNGRYYNPNYYNGYSNPYGYYSPYYYSNNMYGNNMYGNINSVMNTALLGIAIWSLLKK
ncbi:MAG: hypothetical protein JST26_12345 [Bacteroidetes bacterium]|nr:hypothetical protein [Bacteroidota bacterium]